MSENGYVYVLVNPSMEGLIKVGKTTRGPKERAVELSKATGVPTPFFVVYEEYFNNCTKAEEFVHTYLEQKGYRLAPNREFFEVPTKAAIDAIIECKRTMKDITSEGSSGINEEENYIKPWEDIEKMAIDYYFGTNETFQDYKKAFKLFQQAEILGSVSAVRSLGIMYYNANGCTRNLDNSIELLEKAISLGDKSCYAELTFSFLENKHNANAQKSWRKFIEYIRSENPTIESIGGNAGNYIWLVYKNNFQIETLDFLYENKECIINYLIGLAKKEDIPGFFSYVENKLSQPEYFKTLIEMTDAELRNFLGMRGYYDH